jgi:hypothetical protein
VSDFPAELHGIASSILIESGTAPDRSTAASCVLTHLATTYSGDWKVDDDYAALSARAARS